MHQSLITELEWRESSREPCWSKTPGHPEHGVTQSYDSGSEGWKSRYGERWQLNESPESTEDWDCVLDFNSGTQGSQGCDIVKKKKKKLGPLEVKYLWDQQYGM